MTSVKTGVLKQLGIKKAFLMLGLTVALFGGLGGAAAADVDDRGGGHNMPIYLRSAAKLEHVPSSQEKNGHRGLLLAILETSIGNQCINIDGTFGSGGDPTPPAAPERCTLCASGSLLEDWESLAYPVDWNAVYNDAQGSAEDDKTDGQCISEGRVNGKTDMMSTAFASNAESIYFLGSRLGNNGQAVLLFVFTKSPRTDDEAPCGAPEFEPTWLIEEKDFVIRVLFPSSAASAVPEVSTYVANQAIATALNPGGIQDSLFSGDAGPWDKVDGCVSCNNVALPPLQTANQLVAKGFQYELDRDGDVQQRSICEAEINIASLGVDICDGLAVYGSAFSLTSNSGTFKDFLEEQLYDFGGPSAVQSDPVIGCTSATFSAAIATEGPTCQWKLYAPNGATLQTLPCAPGGFTVSFGTTPNLVFGQVHAVTLEVTDDNGCDASDTKTFTPYAPIVTTLTVAPTCGHAFDYTVNTVGGRGSSYTYAASYRIDGGGPVESFSINPVSGRVMLGSAGVVAFSVTATDNRSCSGDPTTETLTVYDPLSVIASLTPNCDGSFNYTATVGGGGRSTTLYDWSIIESTFSTAQSGTEDFYGGGTYSVDVTVTEFCDVCADATSNYCVASDEGNSITFFDTPVINILQPDDEDCGTSLTDDFDPYAVVVSVTGGSGEYTLTTSTSDGAISIICSDKYNCAINVITNDECLAGSVDITAVDQSMSPVCDDTGKRVTLDLTSSTTFGLVDI